MKEFKCFQRLHPVADRMSHDDVSDIVAENRAPDLHPSFPRSATDCPCCRNNEGNRPLYRLRYGEVRQCGRCRTAYTVFDAADIRSANEVFGSRDYVKSRIYEIYNLRRAARARLRRLRAHISAGDLLEFGASTGEFLYESHQAGFRVSCADRYPALLDVNMSKNVVDVFQQDADAFAIGKTFDAVAAFHVLEHLQQPDVFLHKCRDLLTPEGILFLEVPNFGALARWIWRGRWGCSTTTISATLSGVPLLVFWNSVDIVWSRLGRWTTRCAISHLSTSQYGTSCGL